MLAVGPEFDLLAHRDLAVHDAGQNDHAAIGIEPGVEDQCPQRRVGIATRRRHALHDRFEDFVNTDPLLGADQNRVAGIEADYVFNLFANPLGFGGGQIDFINNRNNFEIMVQREISICERLRFDSLRCIDHKQRAFACLQTARHLVGKVHVAGSIDQIELIPVTVVSLVIQPYGMGFDRDAALALEIHGIEHLSHHFPLRKGSGSFQKTVGKGAFTVVDMRNDREIPYKFGDHAVRWG